MVFLTCGQHKPDMFWMPLFLSQMELSPLHVQNSTSAQLAGCSAEAAQGCIQVCSYLAKLRLDNENVCLH